MQFSTGCKLLVTHLEPPGLHMHILSVGVSAMQATGRAESAGGALTGLCGHGTHLWGSDSRGQAVQSLTCCKLLVTRLELAARIAHAQS